MILGLCESPTTFHAIIEWSTALNNGEMQLREILDLDAMLSKDPAPESLSDDEDGEDDGEISEKTAGPSFKDEDEVEEEPEAGDEDEDSLVERRARPVEEEDEEDNTLSLAQMEETLKPTRSRSSPPSPRSSTSSPSPGRPARCNGEWPRISARRKRTPISSCARTDRRGRERAVPSAEDRISRRSALQLQPPPDRAGRPDAAPRRAPQGAAQGFPRSLRQSRAG
jgi:hypothetical protein